MGNTMRWRVIGLWRVRDELPDARIWMHAETDRQPGEDVVAMLRHFGDEMGLPPTGIDYGLPILERHRPVPPARRRRIDRDRGAIDD